MSFAQRAKASADRLARHYGGGATATITRQSTLYNRSTQAPIEALEVRGAHLAGVTEIDLDATSLAGTLIKGATFTIAGDGQTYTTTADVTAVSGVLNNVPISPELQSDAANDAAVTITEPAATYTYAAAVRSYMEQQIDGTLIQSGDRKVLLSAVGEVVNVDEDDQLTVDGTVVDIVSVQPLKPGSEVARWVVQVRGL